MGNRSILAFHHDLAHEVGNRALDVGALLCRAMGSMDEDTWATLERYGIHRVVTTSTYDPTAVSTKWTTFDLEKGTEYENPAIALRKALEMIADGKSQPTHNDMKKWPVSVARIALGRDWRTNHSAPAEDTNPDKALLYSGWMPIELAPRDKELVDLWVRSPENASVGQRITDCSWSSQQKRWTYCLGETGGFIYDYLTPQHSRKIGTPIATHFMTAGAPV